MSLLERLFGRNEPETPGSASVTADGRLFYDEAELIRSKEAQQHFEALEAMARQGALPGEKTPDKRRE